MKRPSAIANASALALVIAVAAVHTSGALADPRRSYESGVVGLVITRQDWNEDRPWAKLNPVTRRVAGVVVEGPYILTTAQHVAGATYVQIEKAGRATLVEPRVEHFDAEVDLALLAVDDPEFWKGLTPVRLARETPSQGRLRTVRWNNQQLESVDCRVKRFEVQSSYLGRLQHVFLQAQTDLSGGGWAEPVFDDGDLVGLTVSQSEQRARVIPAEVLSIYLRRATGGEPYVPFPTFGAKWQVNEDPSLAESLGQTGEPRGVIIRQVPWGSSGCGVLEPEDVLLAVEGRDIDAGGFVTHPRFGRIEFTHAFVDGHEVGDTVRLTVLRDGTTRDVEMTLRDYPSSTDLVPERRPGEPPPYLIAGGLVFRELDGEYLRSWGKEWRDNVPLNLLAKYYLRSEAQEPGRRRIVLLASVLPAPFNVGYEGLRDLPVESVNGVPIGSISDLAEALRRPEGGFHTVLLEPNASRREIVLDAGEIEAADAEILEAYRIPLAMRLPAAPPPDPGPAACAGDY